MQHAPAIIEKTLQWKRIMQILQKLQQPPMLRCPGKKNPRK